LKEHVVDVDSHSKLFTFTRVVQWVRSLDL